MKNLKRTKEELIQSIYDIGIDKTAELYKVSVDKLIELLYPNVNKKIYEHKPSNKIHPINNNIATFIADNYERL
jgi:hypothetical protein